MDVFCCLTCSRRLSVCLQRSWQRTTSERRRRHAFNNSNANTLERAALSDRRLSRISGHDVISNVDNSVTFCDWPAPGYVWLRRSFDIVLLCHEFTVFTGWHLRNEWPGGGVMIMSLALTHCDVVMLPWSTMMWCLECEQCLLLCLFALTVDKMQTQHTHSCIFFGGFHCHYHISPSLRRGDNTSNGALCIACHIACLLLTLSPPHTYTLHTAKLSHSINPIVNLPCNALDWNYWMFRFGLFVMTRTGLLLKIFDKTFDDKNVDCFWFLLAKIAMTLAFHDGR